MSQYGDTTSVVAVLPVDGVERLQHSLFGPCGIATGQPLQRVLLVLIEAAFRGNRKSHLILSEALTASDLIIAKNKVAASVCMALQTYRSLTQNLISYLNQASEVNGLLVLSHILFGE